MTGDVLAEVEFNASFRVLMVGSAALFENDRHLFLLQARAIGIVDFFLGGAFPDVDRFRPSFENAERLAKYDEIFHAIFG